jgi:hypothetical protein
VGGGAERPRRRAEKRDEVAPSHMATQLEDKPSRQFSG